jgi:U3 small nucleolar ribonucleoprotein component
MIRNNTKPTHLHLVKDPADEDDKLTIDEALEIVEIDLPEATKWLETIRVEGLTPKSAWLLVATLDNAMFCAKRLCEVAQQVQGEAVPR